MAQDLLMVAGGLLILVLAGEALVRGAVALSLRLGIPAVIVGLTVVAFGTSAPEMMIAVVAVLENSPALALGNVVGSNIANVLLVLGLPALLATVHTQGHAIGKDYLMMLGATGLLIALAWSGPIAWPQAALMLGVLALMIFTQIRAAIRHRTQPSEIDIEAGPPAVPGLLLVTYLVVGLAGLPLGAHLLVLGATDIARAFGISEAVIGLTLVAVGTSLPEIATSVTAALRGRADLALGNVIGSNIFNILAILGVAGLVGPLPMPARMLHFDLWVMLAVSVLLGVFLWRRMPVGQLAGIGLLGLYAVYVAALAMGAGQ